MGPFHSNQALEIRHSLQVLSASPNEGGSSRTGHTNRSLEAQGQGLQQDMGCQLTASPLKPQLFPGSPASQPTYRFWTNEASIIARPVP